VGEQHRHWQTRVEVVLFVFVFGQNFVAGFVIPLAGSSLFK